MLLLIYVSDEYFGIDFFANFAKSDMCQILMSGTLMSVFALNAPHDGGTRLLVCTFTWTYAVSVLNIVVFGSAVGLYSLINKGLGWLTISIICTIMAPFIYLDISWLNGTIFKKKHRTQEQINRYINQCLGLKIINILILVFTII